MNVYPWSGKRRWNTSNSGSLRGTSIGWRRIGLETQVARVKDPALAPGRPPADLPLGIPAAYWLDLRDYRPAETARGLDLPMLILQGERDYQVTMEDFRGWQQALASRADVRFKSYPALNHLFIAGQGPSTPRNTLEPGNVAQEVVDDIAAWVKEQN